MGSYPWSPVTTTACTDLVTRKSGTVNRNIRCGARARAGTTKECAYCIHPYRHTMYLESTFFIYSLDIKFSARPYRDWPDRR